MLTEDVVTGIFQQPCRDKTIRSGRQSSNRRSCQDSSAADNAAGWGSNVQGILAPLLSAAQDSPAACQWPQSFIGTVFVNFAMQQTISVQAG
jgi:hypothetical protein